MILGATGFIGGQIARAALAAGYSVRAVRRRHSVGALADVSHQIEWVLANLDDVESLVAAAHDCDVLFHAAAHYSQGSRDTGGEVALAEAQMERVLQAARRAGVGQLVYTSSLTTIGPPSQPGRLADERDFYTPGSSDSAYYESKFAMEQMVLRAADDGLPTVALLPTAVFGPGDVKPVTGQVLLMVARGRVPLYLNAPINIVDSRDVAAAHIAAAERGQVAHRYIIGGHNMTFRQALTLAAAAAGVAPPRVKLPRIILGALVRLGDALPGVALPDHARTIHLLQPLNAQKAERELGLTARPIEQTVRDSLAWFREHKYL
jgi:dihydroflavonol-4-reductase